MRAHLLVEPAVDDPGDLVREADDAGTAAPVGHDRILSRLVAPPEPDDVRHVRSAPLVDRLIVVADYAKLDGLACEQLDEPFLGRIDVLILVHHEVPQVRVNLTQQRLVRSEGPHGLNDLLAVGQQAPPFQFLVVPLRNGLERSAELIEREQLVLDHVDVRAEMLDRTEQTLIGALQLQAIRLDGQERRQAVLVEDVVGLESRDAALQELEAVGMDRSDEAFVHAIEERGAPAVERRALRCALSTLPRRPH